MPTREAIVNSVLPQGVEKPIPVRTISTRDRPQTAAAKPAIGNQATTAETPAPAADSATSAESVRLGPAASALARKEQAFRQQVAAFKSQQEQFAAFKEKAEKFERLQQALSAKDYSAIRELGGNYADFTEFELASANSDDPVAKTIAELKAEIAELKSGQEESTSRDYEAVVADYRREASSLIDTNPDFSSIKHLGKEGLEAVVQLITDSWNEDDVEMTAEQACKDIESELYATAQKFSSLPKLKPVAIEEEIPIAQPRSSVNTLTNNMQPPSGAVEHKKSLQHLSEAERYAEARRRVLARRAQQQGT